MSRVICTNADETVYNLLNHLPQCLPSKTTKSKKLYRSIFNSVILENQYKNKLPHRTMGPAVVPKPDPTHPLQKHQNDVKLPEIKPFIRSHKMPPIPKVNKQNQIEIKPPKDYIKENRNKIINSLPKCPRRFIVADRKGNKYLIDGSGLQKDFIYKKDYGKIPTYIQTLQITAEQPSCKTQQDQMIILPQEERLCLINDLKDRYEEIFAEYQHLPLRLETISSISKQKHLTDELVRLEHDIDFLEKHQQIFITNKYRKK